MNKEEQLILAPASIPQENFLESTSTITLYSGSAGAGKTYAIILLLIKYALKRNSTIVVFRRNSTQLRVGGGIWQEACMVFSKAFGKGVKIKDREMVLYIPSTNSTIKFAHLQHQSDVLSHLGSQYSVVIFDEATTFPFEEMILPLMGRLRNAYVDYPCAMYWATNPQYEHGIYHWIKDFYLDHNGIPLKEKSNIERYFVLNNSKPVWFDSREAAEEIYGKGEDSGIRSFRSIRAHVTDNVPLLKAQPDYISNLKAMSDIKQRIYLDGSWTAREEESGYFKRDWVTLVDYPSPTAKQRVRAYDIAMTLPSNANPNPDWTRGVLLSKDERSVYTVEDIVSIRDRTLEVEKLIFDTAIKDGQDVIISLPQDPNAQAGSYARDLQRRLAEMGFTCRLQRPVKSKITRFAPVSSVSQAGFFKVVRADWNKDFFDELELFNGEGKTKDDMVDAISDAFLLLNKDLIIPDMNLHTNVFQTVSQNQFTFNSFSGSTGLIAPAMPLTLPSFSSIK